MARIHDLEALLEDLHFLLEHRVGATEAARRTGFTSATALDKYLRRHGHNQLATSLARQDWDPLRTNGPRRHHPLGRAS